MSIMAFNMAKAATEESRERFFENRPTELNENSNQRQF